MNAGVFMIKRGDYLGQTQTDDAGLLPSATCRPGATACSGAAAEDGLVVRPALELGPDTTSRGCPSWASRSRDPARQGRGAERRGAGGIVVRLRAIDAPVDRRARTS
ncbi:MAG: hypothetical protein R3F62_11860 [Planctomycetota bacterium]